LQSDARQREASDVDVHSERITRIGLRDTHGAS
jgi:hypothetical protein